jgi:hypothetical protein
LKKNDDGEYTKEKSLFFFVYSPSTFFLPVSFFPPQFFCPYQRHWSRREDAVLRRALEGRVDGKRLQMGKVGRKGSPTHPGARGHAYGAGPVFGGPGGGPKNNTEKRPSRMSA